MLLIFFRNSNSVVYDVQINKLVLYIYHTINRLIRVFYRVGQQVKQHIFQYSFVRIDFSSSHSIQVFDFLTWFENPFYFFNQFLTKFLQVKLFKFHTYLFFFQFCQRQKIIQDICQVVDCRFYPVYVFQPFVIGRLLGVHFDQIGRRQYRT